MMMKGLMIVLMLLSVFRISAVAQMGTGQDGHMMDNGHGGGMMGGGWGWGMGYGWGFGIIILILVVVVVASIMKRK